MPSPVRVAVIQSHRDPLPAPWYQACVRSVRDWAVARGFEYRWLGDELFDLLEPGIRQRTRGQRVVASDLARLHALQEALDQGFDRVVWADADVLVVQPDAFELPCAGALFGREVWVQPEGARLRVHRKIHNAFMAFDAGDPVLPFYRHAGGRILARYRPDGEMVAQLIGPKLLTLLHNAIGFDVLESAGMLSPAVARDLLAGGGAALKRFRAASPATPLAVNLCGSLAGRGGLTDGEMSTLVDQLLAAPARLGGD